MHRTGNMCLMIWMVPTILLMFRMDTWFISLVLMMIPGHLISASHHQSERESRKIMKTHLLGWPLDASQNNTRALLL